MPSTIARDSSECQVLNSAGVQTLRVLLAVGDSAFLCDGCPGDRFVQSLEAQDAASTLVLYTLDNASHAWAVNRGLSAVAWTPVMHP
eukprot:879087-Prymnesium_polylepis.1